MFWITNAVFLPWQETVNQSPCSRVAVKVLKETSRNGKTYIQVQRLDTMEVRWAKKEHLRDNPREV